MSRLRRSPPSLRSLRGPAIALALWGAAVLATNLGVEGWTTDTLVTALILALGATAVAMVFGYLGMLSLGTAMFFGIGGYGVAITTAEWGVTPLVGLLIAEALTVVVATVLGAVLVRTSGFYFAIVTLGVSVAFSGLIRAYPELTGGASGITRDGILTLGSWKVESSEDWLVLASVCVFGAAAVAATLRRGRTRRLMGLVRRDELVATVLGARIYRIKLRTFVMSSMIATLAGTLFLYWRGVFIPESTGVMPSVEFVAMAIVGGASTVWGGTIGAVFLVWAAELAQARGDWTIIVYGAFVVITVLFAPNGIVGLVHRIGAQVGTRWAATGRRPVAAPREDGEPSAAGRGVEDAGAASDQQVGDRLLANAGAVPGHGDGAAEAIDEPVGAVAPRANGSGLTVTDVTCRFGGITALDGVSLTAPRGVVTAIVGSNGAGKTTLVNVITGVALPQHGTVAVDGRVATLAALSRAAGLGVARTFQVPRLVEELSVVENVALGRDCLAFRGDLRVRIDHRYEAETEERSRAALADAGLDALADRRAGTLGAGERKKVEIVRAVAWQPSVLLLDEPATGLAAHELDELTDSFAQLCRAEAAILMIDHNLDFVGSLANHVYVMDAGRVVREGRPHEVEGRVQIQPRLIERAPT